MNPRSFAFPLEEGSTGFLVTNDRAGSGPACAVELRLQLLSVRLQDGFGFLQRSSARHSVDVPCGSAREVVPATASIKAVGGLDGMICSTEVNCRKHRQTLTSQRCCQAPTKMVRSQVAGLQYTAHGQCDCRCSRQGLNHPSLLERNMVNPTSLLSGGRPTARKAHGMRGNGTLEKAKAVL